MLLQFNAAIRAQDSAREQLFDRYSDRMNVNPVLTRSLVSFQGNKNRPFVRWLKYKEAFSSEFVEFVFDTLDLSQRGSMLFDPFAGSATALFAAAERGWKASGTELLPIGIMVARARAAAQKVDLHKLSAAMAKLDDVFARYPEARPFPHLRITRCKLYSKGWPIPAMGSALQQEACLQLQQGSNSALPECRWGKAPANSFRSPSSRS